MKTLGILCKGPRNVRHRRGVEKREEEANQAIGFIRGASRSQWDQLRASAAPPKTTRSSRAFEPHGWELEFDSRAPLRPEQMNAHMPFVVDRFQDLQIS
jgi:hypothetical protein